jgi:FkbM family methyltransferase
MANIALENTPLMTHAKTMTRTFVPRAIRNWLRSPSASARWVYDEIRFCFGVRDTIEMRPGWKLTCHPAARRCAYFAQQSDPDQVAEFESFIRHSASGMMLLDIGAHFGLFSLAALHYGGPTARAVAIDPSPVAIRLLGVQAKLNRNVDRLKVIQASVDDHTGWQDMVAVGVLASGYYVAPPNGHPESELTRTKAVTLDGIVEELRFTPSHIKIDVEGQEAAVLRGGQKTLSTSAPILFLEIHNEIVRDLGGHVEDTLSLLRDYGYQTFSSDDAPMADDEILRKPLVRVIARKR